MAMEIVDLPTKIIDFHSYVNVYQRVTQTKTARHFDVSVFWIWERRTLRDCHVEWLFKWIDSSETTSQYFFPAMVLNQLWGWFCWFHSRCRKCHPKKLWTVFSRNFHVFHGWFIQNTNTFNTFYPKFVGVHTPFSVLQWWKTQDFSWLHHHFGCLQLFSGNKPAATMEIGGPWTESHMLHGISTNICPTFASPM